jgi:hypothetical protein
MALEGRSFGEVDWLRAGVTGGVTLIGGGVGFGIKQLGWQGGRALAAGALADFGVGVAADRFILDDSWSTAAFSNAIGFGIGEVAGYAVNRAVPSK